MYYKIIILVTLVLSNVTFGKRMRIVGGDLAHIIDYPYMVSLRFIRDNHLRCGGAIISYKHVLTAAHCLYDCTCRDLLVYAGSWSSIDTSSPSYKIKRFTLHPDYNVKSNDMQRNDIAVITIKEVFTFTERLNKVNLPTSDVSGDVKAVICGWGKLGYRFAFTSEMLRKASMTILNNTQCLPQYEAFIFPEQLCVLEGPGIGACIGDSGGPLVLDGTIVGIASFVLPCATGVPDVYTRVYSFLDFIEQAMTAKKSVLGCNCQ